MSVILCYNSAAVQSDPLKAAWGRQWLRPVNNVQVLARRCLNLPSSTLDWLVCPGTLLGMQCVSLHNSPPVGWPSNVTPFGEAFAHLSTNLSSHGLLP
jgi:hypothetical protein